MKKLVTIVSAVMMLLMLAACAPSLTLDADQAAAIGKANWAIKALQDYATSEGESKDGGYTFTAEEVIEQENSLAASVGDFPSFSFAEGTTFTSTKETSNNTTTVTVSFSGTVTYKVITKAAVPGVSAAETETATVKVEFSGEETNTTGDNAGSTMKYDYFKIDGVGFVPTFAEVNFSF